MLKDTTAMNPKGHVKLELYNESEGVFFTKEKKNLVVMDANSIVANMMADPTKTTRLVKEDLGDTPLTSNAAGHFAFTLSVNRDVKATFDKDMGSSNTEKTLTLVGHKNLTKLISVKANGVNLVINQDVFLKDADEGILEFLAAPTGVVEVSFQKVKNSMLDIIRGTEEVTINAKKWTRGETPDDATFKYAVDYSLGEIYFQNTKVNVKVKYSYKTKYALGFMGLGAKPTGHPDGKPVSYSNGDKLKASLDNELAASRMPIIFPTTVEATKPEIDILPTKPEEFVSKSVTEQAAIASADQTLPNDGGKKLLKLNSVKVNGEDIAIGTDVSIQNAATGVIRFKAALLDTDVIDATYELSANKNTHLIYQLSQSPVVKIVSVVHEDFTGVKTPYTIANSGLSLNTGDVWLMNPNAGILQFSTSAFPIQTPGQITVEYQVNAGQTVKFVADFPKGVPGPIKTTQADTFIRNGSSTFALTYLVAKDTSGQFVVASVQVNGAPAASYTVHPDGSKVDVTEAVDGDTIVVTYSYLKDLHEIYTVAMFDGLDSAVSKMFNISGIGPVVKDKNTGMRVTWSVTF